MLIRIAGACGFSFSLFIAKDGLAREFNLVALFADAFNQDLLALFQLVTDVFDTSVRNLLNV